ncbi:XRE family transcriptional regulator [Nocardia amamiensis]|uniref:XRE family transcriptional regulator n=1 Tax=Nocardia amamiensis TaxID=404578 RepID=A0ABS0CK33_9NOCA|nr:XRE family transcriptional regulator [Nocardia amamiensis]MBF6296162.1 XRE family transcriptional regulator [Nocardia amamiensis]
METKYGGIDVPAAVWHKSEVGALLRQRDVSGLLRSIQRHTGASQARIAAAVGLGQGRVNEIINSRRTVTRFDVFERIADGVSMPDHARVLFGLAPRHAQTRTGHAEIAQAFTVQSEADAELRRYAMVANRIDLLAVRGLGLLALNDSLLRAALLQRTNSVGVRALLLDPDSEATGIRAAEIGESREPFAAGINLALARTSEFHDHPIIDLQVAVYDTLPTWRMLVFDRTLYLSAFGASAEGHRSGMYKLTAATNGVLHAGFLRQFEQMWRQARPIERGSVA